MGQACVHMIFTAEQGDSSFDSYGQILKGPLPCILWSNNRATAPSPSLRSPEEKCFFQVLGLRDTDIVPVDGSSPGDGNGMSVMIINGHRNAIIKQMAALVEMAETLGMVDLMLVDGCAMSLLEFFLCFAPHIRTSIASPDSVPITGFPYRELLDMIASLQTKAFSEGVEEIVRKMAASASDRAGEGYRLAVVEPPLLLLVASEFRRFVAMAHLAGILKDVMKRYAPMGNHTAGICQGGAVDILALTHALGEKLGIGYSEEIGRLMAALDRSVKLFPRKNDGRERECGLLVSGNLLGFAL